MTKSKPSSINAHEDVALFRAAVRFTAAESGFVPRLIEKDYFCTALLAYLSTTAGDEMVFKGGTCLTKVHSELYRLSEDLDYAISVSMDASRTERSQRIDGVRSALNGLKKVIPAYRLVDALKGANQSKQYVAVVAYESLVSQQEETIKVEISLRELLLMPAVTGQARTLLLNPLTNRAMVPPISISSIAKTEALAEKCRAALSRREPAIRDFYDVDHAIRKDGLQTDDRELIDQIKHKLAIPGNEPVNVSDEELVVLRRQLESQLRPVLREKDFADFDLDRAFKIVAEMAKAVA